MKKTYIRFFTLALCAFLFSSCSKSEVPLTEDIDSSVTVTYDADVKGIIDTNCISCHSGSTPPAGLTLTDYFDVREAAENGALIDRINSTANPMPPSGNLPASTLSIIDEWQADGFLEN